MTPDLLTRPRSDTGLWTPEDLEILDDATRREFLAGLAAAGLLVACGRGGKGGDTAAPAAPATRTFVDDVGRRVEVPINPTRIVALNDGNGGAQILDLGFPLIGMTTRDGEFNLTFLGATAAEVSDTAKIGLHNSPNLESITALRPDLIVGYTFDKTTGEIAFVSDSVPQLEAIAPVVFIATFEPIADVIARFGELLGAEGVVAEQRTVYEDRLAEVRSALGGDLDEITVASAYHFGDDALRLNGPNISALEQALATLGVSFSESSPATGQIDVSAEQLDLLEADVLFTFFNPALSSGAQELFDALAVSRAGQVVAHDNDQVRTYDGLLKALDLVESVLTRPDLDTTIVG